MQTVGIALLLRRFCFCQEVVRVISEVQLQQLQALIDAGCEHTFYCCAPWKICRKDVLRLDHYECQICKARGKYRRALVVHHVKHLVDRPDLALNIYDPDTGERQLVSVCKQCHEDLHPESQQKTQQSQELITQERWD